MRSVLFIAAITMASVSSAAAETGTEFYNRCGNGFKAGVLHRGECHSYAIGILTGLQAGQKVCNPTPVSGEQAMMVAQAYMRDHPEELGEDVSLVLESAFTLAWPCRATSP